MERGASSTNLYLLYDRSEELMASLNLEVKSELLEDEYRCHAQKGKLDLDVEPPRLKAGFRWCPREQRR